MKKYHRKIIIFGRCFVSLRSMKKGTGKEKIRYLSGGGYMSGCWIVGFILMFFHHPVSGQNCNCDHLITLQQENVNGTTLNVQPGDTLCIQAGPRSNIYFKNIVGDSLNPVVVINSGGAVVVANSTHVIGIKFSNSRYFRLTGTGVDTIPYGIKVMQTNTYANGISLSDFSSNMEIDHIEIANTGFAGIMCKTNPTCDRTANRGNFTMYDVSIHDNYIHHTGGEAMYIGHSSYSGYPTTCNGLPDTLFPHDIVGLKIFNNRIDYAGWDGIQVGCAVKNCTIFGNRLVYYGYLAEQYHNAGIQLGGGTSGDCYNNYLADGTGIGINVFGIGNNTIYNNVIINAGLTFYPNDPTKYIHGIFCDDRSTIPGRFFNFINNTIVNTKTDGIRFSSTQSSNNQIVNNIIINPGSLGNYTYPAQSYVRVTTGATATLNHNFFAPDQVTVKFRDTLAYNCRLLPDSPARDSGLNVQSMGVWMDHDSLARPENNQYDIGAFEYHPENIWNGKSSSLWTDPMNWTKLGAPLSTDDIIIPAGTSFSPVITGTGHFGHHLRIMTGAALLLESSAGLTLAGDLIIQAGGFFTSQGLLILRGNLINQNP